MAWRRSERRHPLPSVTRNGSKPLRWSLRAHAKTPPQSMAEMAQPILIVTAAGIGSRLAPLTSSIPKCFLPVAIHDGDTESALIRLIRQFRTTGITRIWLAGSGHPWFCELDRQRPDITVVRAEPCGEWAAVTTCLRRVATVAPTLVVSSDNVLSDIDVSAFVPHATRLPPLGCLVAASPEQSTARYTRLEVIGSRLHSLVEKPRGGAAGIAKVGLYYFGPQ